VIEVEEPFLERDLGVEISLDVEHTLPMDWGFTVRFRDYEETLVYNPHILEFHFTDQDLDEHYQGEDLAQKLVVHAPEFFERTLVDLCSLDERQRRASVALIQKTIQLTREMSPHFPGKPKVIVHTGGMSLDHPIEDRQALYDNLRRSVEELDCQGVELLLENLPPHPWYFGGQWLTNAFMDAYEIRDFILPLGLKMCFDTSHSKLYCNWAHVEFYDQVKVLLPYIGHLHLSDAAGLDGEGLQIGEGTIDWVHFFKVIGGEQTDVYHGTMIPEIWRGHQRGNEGFIIAINRLSEAYFAAQQSLPVPQR
jgi:N-acetylneuraminate synthase